MDALPPAHEVQQGVRVAAQSLVGKSADILAVEETVDPSDTLAGGLLDHLNRAMSVYVGLEDDDMELHG